MTFKGKITKNFTIVLDESGTYKTAIKMFEVQDDKSMSNMKFYVNSNKDNVKDIYFIDTLYGNPDLKNSYVLMTGVDGSEIKIPTSSKSFSKNVSIDKEISNVSSNLFFDLIIDRTLDSKLIRKTTDANGNILFLVPSGVRRSKFIENNDKETEQYMVDLENEDGSVLFNVPVNSSLYSKIRAINNTKKVENDSEKNVLNCLSVEYDTKFASNRIGKVSIIKKGAIGVTVELSSMDDNQELKNSANKIEEQKKILDNTKPLSLTSKGNIRLKTAWNEATQITGLLKQNDFDGFLEDYISYVGNNKQKSPLESFNFLTEEEAKELIKTKNPSLYTSMTNGFTTFNISKTGIKLGSESEGMTITKDGVDVSKLRTKDGKNQLTTGPVPIPTVANDANDIKPDGSSFIATPRRYPMMNEITKTLKVVSILTNLAIQSLGMVTDMIELKSKFDEYKSQGK